MTPNELVYPYCGGCGHNYFNSIPISPTEAKEKAKTLRCHYCLEDEREVPKSKKPPAVYWFDEFG